MIASSRSGWRKVCLTLTDQCAIGVNAIRKKSPRSAALLGLVFFSVGTVFSLKAYGFIPHIDVTLALDAFSVFVGALVAGVAGFAFSAVSGAILLHWVPATTAVPLLLFCSITTQLLSITKLWSTMQWRQCVPFLLGGVVGIPVGAKLLESLDAHVFTSAFGFFLVCYGTYMLLRPKIVIPSGSRLIDMAAGFAGGITGGSIAFPGAIPTIWCNIRGLTKNEQRGIVQPFILLMQFATLAYFSKLGIGVSGTIPTYVLCLPAVIGGTWIGLRLFDRIDDAMFRRCVLTFLLISGAIMIL